MVSFGTTSAFGIGRSRASMSSASSRDQNRAPSRGPRASSVGAKKRQKRSTLSSIPSTSSGSSGSSNPSNKSNTTATSNSTSNSTSTSASDEETNIHVYVRCRARNEREIKENSGVVVSTLGHNGKDVILQTGPMAVSSKTYSFDRVFGPESDQEMVFEGIAENILNEMLEGYNCTIFAYGQTGTGKTYTMSGDISQTIAGERVSDSAGIIPRTLTYLFKQLESMTSEFSVKLSFIELYNEELRDLLAPQGNDERKVRIFDDTSKKQTIVQGMEEIFIKSAAEGFQVLNDGSIKRQVAATNCNDHSSRSHSVFTITVHIKEVNPSGEECLRVGKLNLVDLAGSENINRSGAENKRAREAGIINQSLLTLGRVINCLVDRTAHIPYRESKLTRLLQDSLGGRTKTCIIATISPAKASLDETLSTLEYANRAKSIKNKPQVNQQMSKKLLIKEYILEIERLKQALTASRSKNGIYLTEENYKEITEESESRRILAEEQRLRLEVLETKIKQTRESFESQTKELESVKNQIEIKESELFELDSKLSITETSLQNKKLELNDEIIIKEAHEKTEKEMDLLIEKLFNLQKEMNNELNLSKNLIKKREEIEIKSQIELNLTKDKICHKSIAIENGIQSLLNHSLDFENEINGNLDSFLKTQQDHFQNVSNDLLIKNDEFKKDVNKTLDTLDESKLQLNNTISGVKDLKESIKNNIGVGLQDLKINAEKLAVTVTTDMEDIRIQAKESYNTLSENFKSVINTLEKQLSSQANEIINLKEKLTEANNKNKQLVIQRREEFEQIRKEEEQKSQNDKKLLLQQMISMVEESDLKREERLSKRFKDIDGNMLKIASNIDEVTSVYSNASNSWIEKHNDYARELIEQKTTIENNSQIAFSKSDTTLEKVQKQVSKSIVDSGKGVDKQIEALEDKMQCLDEYAKNIENVNEEQHNQYVTSLNPIREGINQNCKRTSEEMLKSNDIMEKYLPLFKDSIHGHISTIDTFSEHAINRVKNINNTIKGTQYFKDENSTPTFRSFKIPLKVPRTKPRSQLISQHDILRLNSETRTPLSNLDLNTEPVHLLKQGDKQIMPIAIPDDSPDVIKH